MSRQLNLGLLIQLLSLLFISASLAGELEGQFPHFRQIDPSGAKVEIDAGRKLTMLADSDFAPWSFVAADGSLKGISVDLALAACKAISATCTVKAMGFNELLPALQRREADIIISGIRPTAELTDTARMTKPYFTSSGKFAVRLGSPVQATDIRTMAGRRIGTVKGSVHEAWLARYYGRSALTSFANFDDMSEALRTGSIDAAFGDSMQLGYWLKGARSRNCCAALGKAFIDRDSFSRNLVFITRKDDDGLTEALDQVLDQLEVNGTTAQVFAGYLPTSVW